MAEAATQCVAACPDVAGGGTVLVVVDERGAAEAVLDQAADCASRMGGQIALFMCLPPPVIGWLGRLESFIRDHDRGAAQAVLDQAADYLACRSGRPPEIHLCEGEAGAALLRCAETLPDLAMVVMGTSTCPDSLDGPEPLAAALALHHRRLRVPLMVVPDPVPACPPCSRSEESFHP